MVENFSFIGSGKLLFGINKFQELSNLATFEKSALICGSSFLRTEQYQSIKNRIQFQFTISGEPDPETIDKITRGIKGKVEMVITVGGGSALDAGKAIAAMCCSEGSIEDYLEGVGTKKPNGKTLPMIAIPTTAGTGSESTKNAVICRRGRDGYKKSLRHDNYIPPIVIMDPLLYTKCPVQIMSSCGMDAFCQLLESYISSNANFYTDMLAWRGLEIFIESFVNLCTSDIKDPDTMGQIAYAAYLSGITLANAGLGTVHGIAGPMGGFFDIPHGTACGTLLPEVMKRTIDSLYNNKPNESLEKLEKLGLYILNHKSTPLSNKPAYAVTELLDDWLSKLKIPRLSAFGISEQNIEKIAINSGNKYNPVQFTTEEIQEILLKRI